MLPVMFRLIWPSGFRGEICKYWPIRNKNCLWRAMFGNGSSQNVHSLERTFHIMLPTKFQFIWLMVFRGEDYNV